MAALQAKLTEDYFPARRAAGQGCHASVFGSMSSLFFAVSLPLWYSRPRLFFDVSLLSLLFLGCLFTSRARKRQGQSEEQPRAAVPQRQRTSSDMTSMTFCALFYHFWQVKFSRENGRFFNLKMFVNTIGVPAGACRAEAKYRPAWHGICMGYMALFVRPKRRMDDGRITIDDGTAERRTRFRWRPRTTLTGDTLCRHRADRFDRAGR